MKRTNVPASAVRSMTDEKRRVLEEAGWQVGSAEEFLGPAEGCTDGFKYHRWVEDPKSKNLNARVCARSCGARGHVNQNGQIVRER